MLLLTLRGTPTMYYGEEIGMTDVSIPANEVQDPAEKNEPGKGAGRDPERTPMQWDNSQFAGFTEAKPWLRLAADCAAVNVETLSAQKGSMLSLYRALIRVRNANAALNSGGVEQVVSDGRMLRYQRADQGQRFAVLLNLGQVREVTTVEPGKIVVSTYMDREGEAVESNISLRPFEGVVIRLA
jgi:alpha-glucosidase